ncbi:hypothetical protein evm_011843 [Chilo suppressalis]|nr:hypothetical protein evm_011843 [Chilo suppressalis]
MPRCWKKIAEIINKGRIKTTNKITYHRLPHDPNMKSRWVNVIRRSRGEDFWQPAKTTVICSDRFNKIIN